MSLFGSQTDKRRVDTGLAENKQAQLKAIKCPEACSRTYIHE